MVDDGVVGEEEEEEVEEEEEEEGNAPHWPKETREDA